MMKFPIIQDCRDYFHIIVMYCFPYTIFSFIGNYFLINNNIYIIFHSVIILYSINNERERKTAEQIFCFLA